LLLLEGTNTLNNWFFEGLDLDALTAVQRKKKATLRVVTPKEILVRIAFISFIPVQGHYQVFHIP
jgi:hypothetical protein